jgi:hypothetical protein
VYFGIEENSNFYIGGKLWRYGYVYDENLVPNGAKLFTEDEIRERNGYTSKFEEAWCKTLGHDKIDSNDRWADYFWDTPNENGVYWAGDAF